MRQLAVRSKDKVDREKWRLGHDKQRKNGRDKNDIAKLNDFMMKIYYVSCMLYVNVRYTYIY